MTTKKRATAKSRASTKGATSKKGSATKSKRQSAKTAKVNARVKKLLRSTGWVPDPPSPHDFTADHPEVSTLLARAGLLAKRLRRKLPMAIDLRPWCSPVQFQGHYNTCTAHVVTSMFALHENRAHGRFVAGSRLFLYQVTKRMIGDPDKSDPGVYLRQMMGSLVLIGMPPESYFPYLDTAIDDDPRIAVEPDAFCYAVAHDLRATRYVRLDPLGEAPDAVLTRIHLFLAAGIASSIGFPLYMSALEASVESGCVPMPPAGEKAVGSHAVLLVGFDDAKVIEANDVSTTGAFLFKNSWGADWGNSGYGWLPYEYLLSGQSHDIWTLLQASWVDTEQFQLGWEQPCETTPSDAASGKKLPQPPLKKRPAVRTRSRSKSPSAQASRNRVK